MKLCGKCKGLGSVPDPVNKGSMKRCSDCNGTGRERETKPVETKHQKPSTENKE